ncbi:hypothetical protein N5C55_02705 [Pseudomonas otitidis]|uniref:hypothetical protein n=1 Tax=Metapseudomonas otitidis TaxID=319939 RepID=UPI00244A5A33|nr:hypothetical protein [Pseudomonas otitidis]MDH1104787.1 hypothetical protein [Pseudomonas otitidis]MDH1157074.1 hypothetical protein [Pseudomonas otitidis]MDH1164698.1 hypothetical protein [Pseudomonas otitidis]
MDNQLKQWREDQKHLPEFMRDFHKCKDLFRGIEDFTLLDDDHPARQVNWRQAQCYTIDVFLWFMARHGYTLQRSRTRLNFDDLDARLDQLCQARRDAFAAAMLKQPELE